MTETRSERSPLARLVLFMICLAIFGSVLAGAHYYAIDLPQQQSLQPPRNDCTMDMQCMDDCSKAGWSFFCIQWCCK
ncbi:MAG: hypothetical protein WC586_03240 [Methanoregula sp.]